MALMGSQYYDEMKKLATGASDENTDNFFAKALSHDSTNAGKEFIPTKYAAEIITFVREKAWHRQIFGTYVMDSLTESIPKFTSGADVKYVPSSISSLDPVNQIPESGGPATDAVVVTLKTLAVNLRLDNKYLEYNANPQVEELLKDELSAAIAYTESDVIVNGDGDGSPQDSDVTATSDPRRAFDGLRKKALAQSTKFTSAAAAAAPADFRKAIQKLGKYALGLREDVVFIISPSIENAVLGFGQLETLEKYGPNATIITGEIGKLYGGSVVVSKVVREDLNDSGVYDGVTTTKTFFLACSKKHFLIGVPRNPARSFKISKKEEPEFDRVRLIAVEDIVFISRHDDAAVICYNITS